MRAALVFAIVIGLALPRQANAQSAYQQGVNDGYNGAYPAAGAPPVTTQYGQGFAEGEDQADEEDRRQSPFTPAGALPPPTAPDPLKTDAVPLPPDQQTEGSDGNR